MNRWLDKLVQEQTPRARFGRRLIALAFGLLLLLIGLRFWLGVCSAVVVDRLRQEGYPTTPRELVEHFPAQKGPNAAEIYRQAFAAYLEDQAVLQRVPNFSYDLRYPECDEPLDLRVLAALGEHVAANARTIELARQASMIGYADFGWRQQIVKPDPNSTFDHLSPLDKLARLLRDATWVAAEHGDAQTAATLLATMLRLSRAVDGEPFKISHAVGTSIDDLAAQALERALCRTTFTDAQLADLDGLIDETRLAPRLQRAIIGTRACSWPLFDDFTYNDRYLNDEHRPQRVVRLLGFNGLGDERFVEHTRKVLAYARQLPQQAPNRRHLNDEYLNLYLALGRGSDFHVAMLLTIRAINHHRLMRIALAIHRYRLDHGRLPNHLDQLVPAYLPAVPIDICDGQSMRYRFVSHAFRIYSVDLDGVDHGGTDYDDPYYIPGESDQVFRVNVPPTAPAR